MPGRRRLALADDLRQQVIQLRHDDQGTEPAEAAIGSVSGRWAEIVGPALAAHTRPDSFADGELAVTADSTAWALRAIEGRRAPLPRGRAGRSQSRESRSAGENATLAEVGSAAWSRT